jgi:D-amino-acid dehydrogenase
MAARPDVLVIGAGAIGSAIARELAVRGADVVVVERRETVGAECSYGNAGLVSPSHCIPLARPGLWRRTPGWLRPGGAVYVRPRPSLPLLRFGLELARSCNRQRMLVGLRTLRDLARASRDLFEELAGEGLEFGYHRLGLMNVCVGEAAYDELRADADLLRREGFEPEELDARAARELEPSLRAEIAGAVFWGEDGHCDPARFVHAVAAAAETAGATFQTGTEITGFESGPDGSITAVATSGGTLRPRTVVLAAGSWTERLARMAGARIPLEPAKGYHVQFTPPAPTLTRPLIFQESVFAATPLDGTLRLAGTMEFVGLDLRLAEKRALRLLHEARSYLQGLDSPAGVETWCGLRPCTPDSLPIVGRSGRVPNLLFATGHAMLGLTLAPVTGRAVADLLVDGASELPLAPLSPLRYGA